MYKPPPHNPSGQFPKGSEGAQGWQHPQPASLFPQQVIGVSKERWARPESCMAQP